MSERTQAFVDMANATFKTTIAFGQGEQHALNVPRLSTGILSADLAFGGGLPFNRVALLYGCESTGKSLLALKAAKHIVEYDHATKIHRDYFTDLDTFEPGSCLYIDAEATFDSDWAQKVAGFGDYDHVVVRPETAEQAIDLTTSALEEDCFDLIIIDSVAAMAPSKVLETSIEQQNVGLNARLMNNALLRWSAKLSKRSQTGPGPVIILINQIREKVGVLFGSNETLTGGRGQHFYPSTIVRMGSSKIESGDNSEVGIGKYKGTLVKNKTYKPKMSFAFDMVISDNEEQPIGYVDNLKELFKKAVAHGIIETKPTCKFLDIETKTQKEMKTAIYNDPPLFNRLWAAVIKAETGYDDAKIPTLTAHAQGAGEAAS